MFDDDEIGAMEAGAAYALYRHGQDRQTRQLIEALLRMRQAQDDDWPDEPSSSPQLPAEPPAIETNLTDRSLPREWEDYVGQDAFKERLLVHLESARIRKGRLPDLLLTSPRAGLGKTTIVRVAARELGVRMIELVPPLSPYALIDAARRLDYKDILYVHEVQDLVNQVRGGGQALRHLVEQQAGYTSEGELCRFFGCTVVVASSRPEEVPDAVADLFPVKGHLTPYDLEEAARLAVIFTYLHRGEEQVEHDVMAAIARVGGGLPARIEELVVAARDLSLARGHNVTPEELLEFVDEGEPSAADNPWL